jgi:hypothetical protein
LDPFQIEESVLVGAAADSIASDAPHTADYTTSEKAMTLHHGIGRYHGIGLRDRKRFEDGTPG